MFAKWKFGNIWSTNTSYIFSDLNVEECSKHVAVKTAHKTLNYWPNIKQRLKMNILVCFHHTYLTRIFQILDMDWWKIHFLPLINILLARTVPVNKNIPIDWMSLLLGLDKDYKRYMVDIMEGYVKLSRWRKWSKQHSLLKAAREVR